MWNKIWQWIKDTWTTLTKKEDASNINNGISIGGSIGNGNTLTNNTTTNNYTTPTGLEALAIGESYEIRANLNKNQIRGMLNALLPKTFNFKATRMFTQTSKDIYIFTRIS